MGATERFQAIARDQHGNVMPGVNFDFSSSGSAATVDRTGLARGSVGGDRNHHGECRREKRVCCVNCCCRSSVTADLDSSQRLTVDSFDSGGTAAKLHRCGTRPI